MPEQKNQNPNPTTKPSNKMHMQVLLHSGLAEVKNTGKKAFWSFWGEVCSENVGGSRMRNSRDDLERTGEDMTTHTKKGDSV